MKSLTSYLAAFSLAVSISCSNNSNYSCQNPPQSQQQINLQDKPAKIKISRVIDGDTFVLASGEKVRFYSLNSPEIGQPHSKEAKSFLEQMLLSEVNEEIILEKDESERDRYNRLLRYAFIKKKNGELIFVDEEIIRNGFAIFKDYNPKRDNKYNSRLKQAEEEAKSNKRGIWNK